MSENPDDWSYGSLGEAQDYRAPRDGFQEILDALAKVERRISDLERGAPLRQAGVAAEPELLRVLQSLVVDGDLQVNGSAEMTGDTEIGGTLGVSADTVIGGQLDVSGLLRILASAVVSGNIRSSNFVPGVSGWRLDSAGMEVNDITLRGGIIGNDALSSPVTGAVSPPGSAAGFALAPSFATKASTTISVPAGFARAVVIATGGVTAGDVAFNRVDARVGIAGDYGAALPAAIDPVGTSPASHSRVLTGLSGGTILLEVQALTAVAVAGAAGNQATITGMAMFFRS